MMFIRRDKSIMSTISSEKEVTVEPATSVNEELSLAFL